MFAPTTVPYPRQDEVDDDEDGVGFALRMATLNGITFNDLACKLASPGHQYLPACASSAIAFMFGSTPIRLEQAFVKRYFRGETTGATFLNHNFLRPYQLRQTHPQICPLCIGERSRALAVWSICLVTSCPVHGIRLMEKCACGRPVNWRRPSIDLCECGRRLTSSDQPIVAADPRELAISQQIAYLLGPAHFRLHPSGELSTVFDALSIDTFLRLVWAFGIEMDDPVLSHRRSANRTLTTVETAGVACHSFDQLIFITTPHRPDASRLRIAYRVLEALYVDCTAPGDLKLVEEIVLRLRGTGSSRIARRAHAIGQQFSFF